MDTAVHAVITKERKKFTTCTPSLVASIELKFMPWNKNRKRRRRQIFHPSEPQPQPEPEAEPGALPPVPARKGSSGAIGELGAVEWD